MRDVLETLLGQSDPLQDHDVRRREVGSDLVAASYREGSFVTSAGTRTDYHLDPSLFMTKPTLLRRLAALLGARIPPDVDRVAGSEPGSVALAAAVSLATGLPYVTVRLPAGGSRSSQICGELHGGERLALVEDVLRSGTHALRSAATLTEHGAKLSTVVAVVDRSEGATAALAGEGIDLIALFGIAELLNPSPPPREESP